MKLFKFLVHVNCDVALASLGKKASQNFRKQVNNCITMPLEKASFVLHSELWEDDFSSMLDLDKDYIVDVWELRKARLMMKISVFHSPSVRIHLGNWGMLGIV